MACRRARAVGCVLVIAALTLATAPAAAARPAPAQSGPSRLGEPLCRPSPRGHAGGHLTRLRPHQRTKPQARLLNEIRLAPIEASLRRRLGEHFAGAWLCRPLAQTLVVATVDPADTSLIASLGAQPPVVSRSLADLERVKEKLSRLAHPGESEQRALRRRQGQSSRHPAQTTPRRPKRPSRPPRSTWPRYR